MDDRSQTVTRVLEQLRDGDPSAADRLLPLVYDELRDIAHRLFRSQSDDHTLEPTALVHEAYLKMLPGGTDAQGWSGRAHFLSVAAIAMRQVLVNHARDKSAQKRKAPGDGRRLMLEQVPVSDTERRAMEVLSVHEALEKLAALDETQARIAELRFFGGLTLDETAEALGISRRKIAIEWKMARAWLGDRLRPEDDA